MNQQALEQQLIKYNELYRAGTPAISDQEYDKLVDQYQRLFPDSPFLKTKAILETAKDSRKIGLPIRMGSLNKLKSAAELYSWLSTMPMFEEIVFTPKFDGISLLVDESNGKAFTRGDGFVGQSCNKHFQKMADVTIACESMYSYGEAIMSKKSFLKFKDNYANARNLVAGLFNRDLPTQDLGSVDYIRYGIAYNDFSRSKIAQLEICNALNTVRVNSHRVSIEDFINLGRKGMIEKINYLFETWSAFYDIDGLVVDVNGSKTRELMGRELNGNPAYARAIKLPEWSSSAVVKVNGITWGVSKQGKLKPVVNIEPTAVAGVTISNVTGYNAKYVFDNNIAKGSVIKIVRSGDVIPKHIETLNYKKENVFELAGELVECPSCGKPVRWDETLTELVCTNPMCNEKRINKLVHFFTIMKVEDFGAPSIRKFYEAGYTSVFKILNMGESQMNNIEGWGSKSSTKLISQFERLSDEGVSFARFLHALDVMEGKLGEKMIQTILDGYDISEGVDTFSIPELLGINGVSNITAEAYMDGIQRYFIKYEGLPVMINQYQTPKVEVSSDGKMVGFKICFTGVRPSKEQEELINKNGGEVVSGVSKTTTHLVVKDINSTSSKTQKAQDLGVKILTIENLFN